MKQPFFIPRVYLPRENFDKWACLAGDRFAFSHEFLKRRREEIGDATSTLRFVFSENFFGGEEEEFAREVREEMFAAIERDRVEKLLRGAVLVERRTAEFTRRGIVACIDLEAYTVKRGESSLIRPVQEADNACAAHIRRLRAEAPLEFTHTVVLYKEPKNKVMKKLLDEDLEELYSFRPAGGGTLRGWFIPEYTAEVMLDALPKKGDPAFVVIDGVSSLAGAKLYWEELKESLPSKERLRHPARFALVEFENICDDGVRVNPVSRLLTDTDNEAFCDFLSRSLKCTCRENVVQISLPTTAENIVRADELVQEYLRANGGNLFYVSGEEETKAAIKETGGVALSFQPIEKDDLFAALKDGKLFPKKSLALGGEGDARYYTEGREISYD